MKTKLTIGKTRTISEGLRFIEVGEKKHYSIGEIVHPDLLVIIDYNLPDNSTSRQQTTALKTAEEVVKRWNMHDELVEALKMMYDTATLHGLKEFDASLIKAKQLLKQAEQK